MNDHTQIDTTNATPMPAVQAPPPAPNMTDISAHLYALFDPAFVQAYPEAWIEIAYGHAASGGAIRDAQNYSVFKLKEAAEFAEARNKNGDNIYVGPALREGKQPGDGRADGALVLTSSHGWVEDDGKGDDERIDAILMAHNLSPKLIVTTGSNPYPRRHLYFGLDGIPSPDQLKAVNVSLKTLLGSDAVQDPVRIMRLAGTINYPTPDKQLRGYVAELVTLRIVPAAPLYKIDALIGLTPTTDGTSGDPYADYSKEGVTTGRTDDELMALLEKSKVENWHDNILKAVATMIGRGWPDSAIKITCAPYCRGGKDDPDLPPMIDKKREEWNKPSIEEPPSDGDGTTTTNNDSKETDIDRMNGAHAVLPIGGKTRVVTFGELPDFPGRETIVMTQTIDDFKALQNKYRHTYRDKESELKSQPMGSHWINSPKRRQFDGGMAFMPQHDERVVGKRLNLFNGFGVKPIKPDGKSGAAGCDKFLDFMLNVMCS